MDEAQALADAIGYPVVVKAAVGGGGRGMRIVRARDMLAQAFATAGSRTRGKIVQPRRA